MSLLAHAAAQAQSFFMVLTKLKESRRRLSRSVGTAQPTTPTTDPRQQPGQPSAPSDRQEEQPTSQTPPASADPNNHEHTPPAQIPSPPVQADQGFPCPDCDRFFRTKGGLGVHRRWKHLEKVNEEVNVDKKKPTWSKEEIRIMAREEALVIVNGGVPHINVYLRG